MARLSKTLIVGLVTGILGIGLNVIPAGLTLEERFGLPLLFFLRGPLKPPSDVVVVALDQESAQRVGPKELIRFLNDYYETIFPLVQHHGGRVSDIIGDSMLAVWAGNAPHATLRERACLAAIDIARAVECFNETHASMRLPTRIGLSFGQMSFGHIGGADHFEYRPVGDTVNVAARIEALNKALGTRILVAEEVLGQLDCLKSREIGTFVLAGKTNPVTIHELLCCAAESNAFVDDLCDSFSRGLSDYRNREGESALRWFRKVLELRDEDGPARFYFTLCDRLAAQAPDDAWDGSVTMGKG